MEEEPQTDPARDALRRYFGHADFRDGQGEVVERLLAGESVLAVFPTGTGKSLCFQLPALVSDGLTVVISPLLALVKDQVDRLQAHGHAAERMDSTQDAAESARVIARIESGDLRLLYLSPERFAREDTRRMLRRLDLSMLVVDEAHCVVEWGHQFRPDYLLLARHVRRLPFRRVAAFTATATKAAAREIRRAFRIPKGSEIRLPAARPNLALHVASCRTAEKDALLRAALAESEGPALVYVARRQAAEAVTAMLRADGLAVRAFHAGLPSGIRSEVLGSFLRGETRVVVATIAFGMGIDKADIRQVIHYHLPRSLEGYAQECGRAGRDGLPARCLCLASRGDLLAQRSLITAAAPDPRAVEELVSRLLRAAPETEVSLYDWSVAGDIEMDEIDGILTRLELRGIVRRLGSRPGQYRFRWMRGIDAAISGRPARETAMVRRLQQLSDEVFGRRRIEVDAFAADCGITPARVDTLMRSLAASGDARVEPRRFLYRLRVSPPDNTAGWSRQFAAELDQRRQDALERLGQVERLLRKKSCMAAALAAHFGDRGLPPCGKCGPCTGHPPLSWPPDPPPKLTDADRDLARGVVAEKHAALSSPLRLARFLFGRSSPAIRHARLSSHPAFGHLGRHDFQDLTALATALLHG